MNCLGTLLLLFLFVTGCNPFAGLSVVKFSVNGITWNKPSHNYGNQNVGAPQSETFSILNTSDEEVIDCNPIQISDTTNFHIISSNCIYTTMRPKEKCDVEIQSDPQNAGTYDVAISRECKSKKGKSMVSVLNMTVTGIKIVPDVTKIFSSDRNHVCALYGNKTVKCWGANGNGQLGDATTANKSSAVSVSNLAGQVADLAVGHYYTCALLVDKSVQCWGVNNYGQLGDGTTNQSLVPVSVNGLADVSQIAVAESHSCALIGSGVDAGKVKCWGRNYKGMVRGAIGADASSPVVVNGISNAIAVSIGTTHSCALINGGTISCWGDNFWGQLGDGTSVDSATPVLVSSMTSAVDIKSGFAHMCALMSDGKVKCWGRNGNSRLGVGSLNTKEASPLEVVGLSGVATAIDVGAATGCATLANKKVECWGNNSNGQLGDGTLIEKNYAVEVTSLSDVKQVITGADHSCSLLEDKTILCWGANSNGQLGDSTFNNRSTPSLEVTGL